MTQQDEMQLVELKRREAQLRRMRLELQKKHGIAFYQPHEKQDLFHRAWQYKRRMVRAGNRFGKSTMGCAEDIAWLMGERAWYAKDDPARYGGLPKRPIKLLTICQDWDLVDSIWTSQRGDSGKVWKMLPSDALKTKRVNHSSVIDTIELNNGSLWRFDTVKSWMSDPKSVESSDWDAIHVDEPCPEKMFKGAARGLVDRNGSCWFTLTPLSEAWITDFFFPSEVGDETQPSTWAIDGTMYDNPTLSREAIELYVSTLDEDEKQCRIFGIPLHLAGLVYKQFSFAKHVLPQLPKGWESWTKPPVHWTYYAQIDPHPRTPHAVLFCAVDELNRRYYFADIFEHCKISDLCDRIREVLAGRMLAAVRVDPSAYVADPVTELSMADEFCRCGIYVEKASKSLAEGILKVQGELGNASQMMWFTPACRRTLWEVLRYSWDEKRPDKPVDKDDHCMECLYRMELLEPRYLEYTNSSIVIPEIIINKPEFDLEKVSYDV